MIQSRGRAQHATAQAERFGREHGVGRGNVAIGRIGRGTMMEQQGRGRVVGEPIDPLGAFFHQRIEKRSDEIAHRHVVFLAEERTHERQDHGMEKPRHALEGGAGVGGKLLHFLAAVKHDDTHVARRNAHRRSRGHLHYPIHRVEADLLVLEAADAATCQQ